MAKEVGIGVILIRGTIRLYTNSEIICVPILRLGSFYTYVHLMSNRGAIKKVYRYLIIAYVS